MAAIVMTAVEAAIDLTSFNKECVEKCLQRKEEYYQ
jgi:hypothetical protein